MGTMYVQGDSIPDNYKSNFHRFRDSPPGSKIQINCGGGTVGRDFSQGQDFRRCQVRCTLTGQRLVLIPPSGPTITDGVWRQGKLHI